MLTLEEKERIFFDAKINFEGQFDADFLMKLLFGKHNPDHIIRDEMLWSNKLHVAVTSKDCSSALIQSILVEDPEMLNQKNIFQVSPLHRAVYCAKNLDVVTELLKHGAHVNAVERSLMSPLHIVARNDNQNQHDLLQILIEYGGNVKCIDYKDQTPLHMLVKNRVVQTQSLCLLLQSGADPNACDRDNISVLRVAVENRYASLNTIKILLMYGANPDNELKHCWEKVSIAKLLIQYIAVKNIDTVYGHIEGGSFELQLPTKFVDLSCCRDITIFMELYNFLDSCISELITMRQTKLDHKYTLLKFIKEHCCNVRFRDIGKSMSLMEAALLSLKYRYAYCSDLIEASFDFQDVLSLLSEHGMYTNLSGTSSGSDRIYLNYYIVSYLASYLSKNDLIHLAVAYLVGNKQRNQTKKKMCILKPTKRTREGFNDSMMCMKRLKL